MRKYFLLGFAVLLHLSLFSQDEKKTSLEIFGYVMTDGGYNFGQVNPDYFDVMRPTQLPAYENQYGTDGNVFFSVRQTLFGVRSSIPTKLGDMNLIFAFDLFGVGPETGRTAFHMLHAYGEIGMFGFGHNWSLFSDVNGYPNMIEYWGPVGMSLCKNVQFRFIPLQGENRLAIALERPGATADEGIYANWIALDDVEPKFNLPDLSAEFRMTREWGYAELAGIIRKIEWVDQGNDEYELSGKAMGWGLNLSTNLKLSDKDLLIAQGVVGEGIESLMNDAPTDIAVNKRIQDLASAKGVPVPISSFMVYLNHSWSDKFSTAIGYSGVYINNTDGQLRDAFKTGNYASANLLYYPVENMTVGLESQWIKRENFRDGWTSSATRVQLSVRYNFTTRLR